MLPPISLGLPALSAQARAPGQLQLKLSGRPTSQVLVQRTTALGLWEDWKTTDLETGSSELEDLVEPVLPRFYRVKQSE